VLPRLPPVQESRLRVLRVVLTENKLSHLALMQQLEHLYLVTIPRDGPFPSSVFEALSKLPSLQFLSIRMTEADPIELDIVASLLDHLPPSLTHLHFPDSVPFDSLITRLQTDKLPRIKVVGVGEWDEGLSISLRDYKNGLARLGGVCEEKGIEIKEISDPLNVFGTLPPFFIPILCQWTDIPLCLQMCRGGDDEQNCAQSE